MNKTEFVKCIDEIYLLGLKKEYKLIFNKMFPSISTVKSTVEILIDKKKSYIYELDIILKKYNIIHDTLHDELDQLWQSTVIYEIEKIDRLLKLMSHFPPLIVQNIEKLQNIFNQYIKVCTDYCKKIIISKI